MRRPHGYFYGSADAEHGRAFEADSLMCPHCNAHFAVVPNATPAQLGQFCTNCMAQCCVKPACNAGCRPFMKAIEAAEAKMRLRALVCLIVLLLASPVFAQPHATVLADRILTGHGNQEFVPRFATYLVTLGTMDLSVILAGIGGWTSDAAPTWDSSSAAEQHARAKADSIVAATGCANCALVLHNLGAGEYTTGTGVIPTPCDGLVMMRRRTL